MKSPMTSIGYDELKSLVEMTTSNNAFVAKFARATLSVLEGLRDAEIRAARAEAALAVEGVRIDAIKSVIARLGSDAATASGYAEAVHHISDLINLPVFDSDHPQRARTGPGDATAASSKTVHPSTTTAPRIIS